MLLTKNTPNFPLIGEHLRTNLMCCMYGKITAAIWKHANQPSPVNNKPLALETQRNWKNSGRKNFTE